MTPGPWARARWVACALTALAASALAVATSPAAMGSTGAPGGDPPRPAIQAAAPSIWAASLSDAASAPTDSDLVEGTVPLRPNSDCTNTDGVPYAAGLPPLPCSLAAGRPGVPSSWSDYGALFSPVTQQILGSATTIAAPRTITRLFTYLCGQANQCPEGFTFHAPASAFVTSINGYGFVQSPLGADRPYGVILDQRVSALAFGAIPVSARVTVRQASAPDGSLVPLRLSWAVLLNGKDARGLSDPFDQGQIAPGFYAQYGPAPFGGANVAEPLSFTGPIEIQLSEVRIDTMPVDVGTRCQVSTSLDIFARGGWLPPAGTPGTRGEQGEYSPLFPPGYLHSLLDIPSFTTCGTASENLSSIVSSLVSGADNPTELTQATAFGYFGCLPKGHPLQCFDLHPPTVDPTAVKGVGDSP